jgi:NAD(P)H-flavin reductase
MAIVGRFVLQIVVGALLFAGVAGVAYILSLGISWLEQQGAPEHILFGARAATELLWGLDLLCFVVYICGETFKLLREIWRDLF